MTDLGCISNCQDLSLPTAPTAPANGVYRVIIRVGSERYVKRLELEAGDEIKIPADSLPKEAEILINVITPSYTRLTIAGEITFKVKVSGDTPLDDCIC